MEYILSIPKFGVKSGLDNIRILLEKLNNPHRHLKCIHVAGTNGKGSICSMLSQVLIENGSKTGLFTSPHLIKYNERIKINNRDINDKDIVDLFSTIKIKIDEMIEEGYHHPTFFEVTTVIAFLYFYTHQVDVVVLETGLGGRLDPTNIICHPLVSVITWIGLDHNQVLGDHILDIAKEKAGIIKNNCPTVLYPCTSDIYELFYTHCKQKKSPLYYSEKINYNISKKDKKTIEFSIRTKYYNYKSLSIHTIAEYQIHNASIALLVIEALKSQSIIINKKVVKKGMSHFNWAGRMESIGNTIILDGAHNLDGIKQFVKEINHFNQPKTLLFSCMKDKPYQKMIQTLKKCHNIDKVIITQMNYERAVDVKELYRCFEASDFNTIIKFMNQDKAIDYALSCANKNQLVCCIGSLYLVGDIKKTIHRKGNSDD